MISRLEIKLDDISLITKQTGLLRIYLLYLVAALRILSREAIYEIIPTYLTTRRVWSIYHNPDNNKSWARGINRDHLPCFLFKTIDPLTFCLKLDTHPSCICAAWVWLTHLKWVTEVSTLSENIDLDCDQTSVFASPGGCHVLSALRVGERDQIYPLKALQPEGQPLQKKKKPYSFITLLSP